LATEWGVQSFVLYIGFLGSTMVLLHRTRKLARGDLDFYYRSLAIQVGLVSTLTAATFSNRFLGESIYWLCGLAFALYRVSVKEFGAEAVVPVPEPAHATFRPAATATS
jgi:hypothetical protein